MTICIAPRSDHMNSSCRSLAIAFLCLLLVGCYKAFPPVKSANVTHWQDGKPQATAQQLAPEQVKELSDWLQSHRWGWHPVMATYQPSRLVWINHADDTKTSANLMEMVITVGQHQRSLSETESQELHSIIGVREGG